MNLPVELHNLAACSLQAGLLAVVGSLLPRIFRIRQPKVLLPYWQILLIFCLLFPWLAPSRVPIIQAASSEAKVVAAPVSAVAIVLPPAVPATRRSITWSGLLMAAVIVGALARCAWLLLGLLKLRAWRKAARQAAPFPPEIEGLLHRVRVNTEILVAPGIESPATYGYLHPLILLPEKYQELDVQAQSSILAHELIHVRRHDWPVAMAEQLLLALFWFHPAVWWLVRRIEVTREQVVDRQVLELNIDRRKYLESLLCTVSNHAVVSSANQFFTRHHLQERVALLLEEIHMSTARIIASLALAAVVLSFGAVMAMSFFPLTAPTKELLSAPTPMPVELENQSTAGPATAAPRPATQQPAVPEKGPESPNLNSSRPMAAPRIRQEKISGTVVDPSRARIPNVEITVTDPETKDTITTAATDLKGDFAIEIPAGQKVQLTFRSEGFRPAVVNNAQSGQSPMTITLMLGSVNETVTIVAGSLPGSPASGPKLQPMRIGGNVHFSKLIRRVDPIYPMEARQQGIEGVVIVEAYVGLEGEVLSTRVMKGIPPLDDAAVEAIRQWRYTPCLLNGEPQLWLTTVTLVFKLDKD
jgi:TonB family protein